MDHTGLRRRRGNTIIHTPKRKTIWILGTYNVRDHIESVLNIMIPHIDALYVLDTGSIDTTVLSIQDYMRDYDIPIKIDIVRLPSSSSSIELYRNCSYKNAVDFCRTLDWDIAFTDTFIYNEVYHLEIVPITQLKIHRVCPTYIKLEQIEHMAGVLYNLNTRAYHMLQYAPLN